MSSHAKLILVPKVIPKLFYVPVRHKVSRWLGYYNRRAIPAPVYEERKQNYRDKVLQPLETMPSLKDRLKEMNAKDPVLDARVDIGLPSSAVKNQVSLQDRLKWQKAVRANKDLEKLAREKKIKVDLDEVYVDWQKMDGQMHIRNVAEHYGLFRDLFDHGYFVPRVPLSIYYDYDKDCVTPVYTGNILEAAEAKEVPRVHFESKPDDLWTLLLTNLDGNLLDTNCEYLHWFVGNIKGSDIKTGEVICDYLQPFPFRGTGYHRLVFVLYKQETLLDYSKLSKPSPCLILKERTFKTFDFYKSHQDVITPAGLAFFQCIWDKSLTNFFHNTLNMREPVFEYRQPEIYYKKQVQFPHLEPFNVYLDRYRDPKEIRKEVLLKRLKTVHPFKEEPPMPKYPCLHKPEAKFYTWQKDDILRERLRIGKFRDLRPHSVYPQDDSQGNYNHKN